jgi:pSer/pThr/pTyr-binding forkhead associated (FHA) protein
MVPLDNFSISYMSGPQDGKVVSIPVASSDEETVVILGRRENCDILLDYDTQVSRTHARVIYEPTSEKFFLEDMGSKNGTFLQIMPDRITDRVHIGPGELFRVGRTWLRVDPLEKEDSDLINSQDGGLPF